MPRETMTRRAFLEAGMGSCGTLGMTRASRYPQEAYELGRSLG